MNAARVATSRSSAERWSRWGKAKVDHSFRRPITWVVAVYSAIVVACVTWLDASCFFELGAELRYLAASVYLVFLLPFLRRRPVQVIAAGSALWMLVILPQVRWNHAKSFYVDARSIEPGMTAEDVLRIMKPYLEVRMGAALDGEGRVVYRPTEEERQWEPWCSYLDKGMIFLHSVAGWTDHCEVHLDGSGRVRTVHIEKD